jgi:hypothetical protein
VEERNAAIERVPIPQPRHDPLLASIDDRRPTSPVKALRGLLSELLGFVEVLLDDRQRFSGKGLYRVVRPYRHISRIASRRLHGR